MTGGPEVLAYVERPVPAPAPGQLLIKTEAIGVNFVDTYFRTGLYPHALPFILGSEVAGTVAAVGEGVHTAHVGDRVATSDADGAYAEYCLASADLVCHVPDGLSAEVAASAILKGQTAHLLIKSVYPIGSGDIVLLHAGAGGVGLILIQWATSLGARLITTVSTDAKAELCRRAGAVDVLGYPDDPATFGAKIRSLSGGGGVAAVYDGVGRSTFDASLASLAVRANAGAVRGAEPAGSAGRPAAAERRGLGVPDRPLRPHSRYRRRIGWRTDE